MWDAQIIGSGDREARPFYAIPHQRTVSAGGWMFNSPGMHPFNVGPWRAPSVNSNTFGRESHIDVMAGKGGFDPLEFRLTNLTDARMRRVLEAAAEQFGWKAGRAPSGRGAGVACGIYSNSCNATMAEVAVQKDGGVQVKRVVMALDVGEVLNPDSLRQQAEGAVMMGFGLCALRGGPVSRWQGAPYGQPVGFVVVRAVVASYRAATCNCPADPGSPVARLRERKRRRPIRWRGGVVYAVEMWFNSRCRSCSSIGREPAPWPQGVRSQLSLEAARPSLDPAGRTPFGAPSAAFRALKWKP